MSLPLLQASHRGDYRSFYTCGTVIHFLVDRHISRESAGDSDIADLFARMFAKAAGQLARYSTFDYLETFQDLTGKPLLIGPIARLLYLGAGGRVDELLRDQLIAAGVSAALVAPSKARLDGDTFMRLLARALARCDCGSRRSVRRHPDRLHFQPLAQCGSFKEGMVVTGVGDATLKRRPGLAYELALAHMRRGEPVPLQAQGQDQPVMLHCPAERVDRSFAELLAISPE